MAKSEGGGAGLIRGKVGGWVFYVVNGEQRIRELTPVFNPQSARQMEVRSINTELSRFWRDELTEGNRIAWAQRAEGSGMRAGLFFIRQNFQLLDFAMLIQATPPPMTPPPELTDVIINPVPPVEQLSLDVPQLIPGIITAQEPFLDIEVAGGFTQADLGIVGEHYEASIQSEALSQGRKHQNSDFRHVLYAADLEVSVIPEISKIIVAPPGDTIRNIVIRLTRFNKFGNRSGVRIYNAIVAGPEL